MFSIMLEVLGDAEELCVTLGGNIACLGFMLLNQLSLIAVRLSKHRGKTGKTEEISEWRSSYIRK